LRRGNSHGEFKKATMIVHQTRFLTQGEVWFEEDPAATTPVDWVVYNRRSRPVPGARCRETFNSAIDLTRTVDDLKAQLNTDNAYKIRRARERDNIVCEVCDPRNAAVLDQFQDMYNSFAALKGLQPLPRRRVDSLIAAGRFDLSAARDPRGDVLVFHGNYRASHRATSLYTVSLYRKVDDSATRNLIGRANRYLVWSDLVRYKAQGLTCFDFGGWYHGTDAGMLKINEFKRGFGGEIIREFQCERIVTLKGRLVLSVAAWLKRSRLWSAPARTQPGTPVLEGDRDRSPSSPNANAGAGRRVTNEPELAR
jgi:hypothetical protein